jgi:RNA polymerase sigma-70 factor (ECF subfamily)
MQKPLQSADLIALLARVAKQDRNAFSALYAATSAKLFGVVWRILPAQDRAEDVLQDVYVKIWNRAASFDATKASPITWMATIARNRAIDEVRRRAPVSIEDAPQARDVAAEGLNPLEAAQQSAELRQLQDCLQGLEPERREIVLLAYYTGLSRDEIAQRFGHPVGTIKVWLHRSLAQLRKCLGS